MHCVFLSIDANTSSPGLLQMCKTRRNLDANRVGPRARGQTVTFPPITCTTHAPAVQGGMHWGRGWRLGPAPDGLQGWGRMSLAGSLPLPGATPSGFRLQVADMMQFTATGQSVTLGGLEATGGGWVGLVGGPWVLLLLPLQTRETWRPARR